MDYKKLLENEKVQYILKNIIDYETMVFRGRVIEKLSFILKLLDDIEHEKYPLEELYKLTESFKEVGLFYRNWEYYKQMAKTQELISLIEFIDYILDYLGNINLNYFYSLHGLKKENLIYLKNLILNDFYDPKIEKQKQEKKREEEEKFIIDYYKIQNNISKKDIEKYINYNREIISIDSPKIENISYPVIVFKYKDNELISISKVTQNLYNNIGGSIMRDDIDSFAFMHVSENILNEIYLECLLHFQPKKITSNSFGIANSLYVTFSKLKKRYKGVYKNKLEDIIDKYNVPIYKIRDQFYVVHRDKFDEAYEKEIKVKR